MLALPVSHLSFNASFVLLQARFTTSQPGTTRATSRSTHLMVKQASQERPTMFFNAITRHHISITLRGFLSATCAILSTYLRTKPAHRSMRQTLNVLGITFRLTLSIIRTILTLRAQLISSPCTSYGDHRSSV